MTKSEKLYNILKPQLKSGLTFEAFEKRYYASESSFNALMVFIIDSKKLVSSVEAEKYKKMLWYRDKFNEHTMGELYTAYVCGDERFVWAANTYWCKNPSTSNSNNPIYLKDYEGLFGVEGNNYVKIAVVSVAETGDKLDVNFPGLEENKLYGKYANLQLVHTTGEKFDVYGGGVKMAASEIVYSSDKNQFDFNIMGVVKGVAKKGSTLDTDVVTPTPTDSTNTANDSSSNNSNSGQVKVVKNIFNFPDVKDNQPGYVSPESNTQDCKDFPFTIGCINKNIGDINEKFFGKGHRRGEVFGTELLDLLTGGGYLNPNDKDPKITEELYGRIMKDFKKNVIKESVKKVLKEYINKKK